MSDLMIDIIEVCELEPINFKNAILEIFLIDDIELEAILT
jgi:hypothetical protein